MAEVRLVGREQEIQRLCGFLAQAIEGATSICRMTGEPGAGEMSLRE